MDKVIVIVGPTAVGKTKLSVDLAKKLNAEIISGDSMQIYKGMNIGTGKITEEEKQGIPHYMLDIIDPDEPFSVADYQNYVQNYIKDVNLKNKLPIIVGGSGLYIQSVLYNYRFTDRKRDENVTKQLELRLQQEGIEPLYEKLTMVDPEQAKKIHPNNHRRVIRALEIYETTGLTMSEIHKQQSKSNRYHHLIIGLEMERKALYKQINERVDKMVETGLVAEVTDLYNKGYEHFPAIQAIGYKEMISYLKGEISLQAAVEMLKRNSRRYAKRQYTWFKNKMDVNWYLLNHVNYDSILQEVLTDIHQFFNLEKE